MALECTERSGRTFASAGTLAQIVLVAVLAAALATVPLWPASWSRNALPSQDDLAVPSRDDLAQLPTCGDWCEGHDAEITPCELDQAVTPCAGGAWCTTTCGMWTISRLGDPLESKVPCEVFAQAGAYAKGGLPCDPKCLSPEISPTRYPSPTGLGFFCDPGTCNPPVQARYEHDPAALARGMRVLQCPCHWFASDCTEGRELVRAVVKGASSDGLQVLRIEVGVTAKSRLIATHRPGGAVRILHYDDELAAREQPYALSLPALALPAAAGAGAGEEEESGFIELLSGPAEDSLDPRVTEVARRLRALPPGRWEAGEVGLGERELWVYPTLSGFYNRKYAFLLDTLELSSPARETSPTVARVEHVFVVATGSGLGGAASAVASLEPLVAQRRMRQIHFIYGVRSLADIPQEWRQRLARWAGEGGAVTLTVITSSPASPTAAELLGKHAGALHTAEQRGHALRSLDGGQQGDGRFYVQHALAVAFRSVGYLAKHGASFRNTALVGCSRVEVVDSLFRIWGEEVCRGADDAVACDQLAFERVFINV
ncbi:hypothetical protein T492DRAFT_955866 [Pavlovales sp. CCMP2436]|nr:hypothetical protein T492DRAFT_955866 [Pavlovales sp. CCMP2436]